MNRFLYNELCKIAPDPEIYLFEDIAEGINHFVDTTGVKAEQRLTPEEVEEIKREEKALPNLNQSSEAMRNILQKMGRLGQPSDSMLKALKNIVEPAVMNYKSPKMLGELQQPLSQVHFLIKNIQEEISEKPQGPPSSPRPAELGPRPRALAPRLAAAGICRPFGRSVRPGGSPPGARCPLYPHPLPR